MTFLSYGAAHARVKAAKGRAAEYLCACGQNAKFWAYNHKDVEGELSSPSGVYSGNPDFYEPMCSQCHRSLDFTHRALSGKAYPKTTVRTKFARGQHLN